MVRPHGIYPKNESCSLGAKSDMELNDLQEVFRLLELREEYTAFIMDLESELDFLKHIEDCKLCREEAKMITHFERIVSR